MGCAEPPLQATVEPGKWQISAYRAQVQRTHRGPEVRLAFRLIRLSAKTAALMLMREA